MLCLLKTLILVKHHLKQKWETFQGGDRELGWALSPAEGYLRIVASGHNFGLRFGGFLYGTYLGECHNELKLQVLYSKHGSKVQGTVQKSQLFSSSPFYFVRSYLGGKVMVESSRKATKARKMDKNQHTSFGQNCAVMWYEITKSYVCMQ